MGKKLPRREAELYRRCDEVLHYIWDPIGVSGAPGARDEYHSYLPQVFNLVRDNADPAEIVAFLTAIEEQSMGLSADFNRAQAAVEVLFDWREWIWEQST